MVYIIGTTDHRFQYDGHDDDEVCNKLLLSLKDKFKNYIIKQVIKLNIVLIGEEFSEEALNRRINNFGATNTSARLAAIFTKIEHRFCDPNTEERKNLGIPTDTDIKLIKFDRFLINKDQRQIVDEIKKEYWPIRERFWLENIIDKVNEPIIFICGADHSERFKSLLIREGLDAEILINDWKGENKYS